MDPSTKSLCYFLHFQCEELKSLFIRVAVHLLGCLLDLSLRHMGPRGRGASGGPQPMGAMFGSYKSNSAAMK